MITIQKYEKTKDLVTIELLISNPYTGNSDVRTESFKNEDTAQHYYWNLIWSHLNWGVEQFVEHCKSIAEHYLNPRAIPFYNDENWRQNYWVLLKKFNTDYFGGVIDTIENKANHIIEHQAILVNAITVYNQSGHKEAKQMITELLSISKTIIDNKDKIQKLTPLPIKRTA